MYLMMLGDWPSWPEEHYHRPGSDWRVFPLCYTFPGNDPSRTVWVNGTCSVCPKTTALLKRIPNIRTALFSRLGSDSELGLHRGWADLSNHILRSHLGLVIPGNCAMIVGGETQYHATGEILMFDDSKLHKAFNNSESTRIILIVDVYRPDHLPRGRAIGAHTDELDDFISSFGLT